MTGLNFNGSNAVFNPQVVYKKDLSNSTFEKVFFSPFANFTGVNIENSVFSFDNDRKTIDLFNSSIGKSIYNENTRINEQTVDEFISSSIKHEKK